LSKQTSIFPFPNVSAFGINIRNKKIYRKKKKAGKAILYIFILYTMTGKKILKSVYNDKQWVFYACKSQIILFPMRHATPFSLFFREETLTCDLLRRYQKKRLKALFQTFTPFYLIFTLRIL
jgi:hypothetical protein